MFCSRAEHAACTAAHRQADAVSGGAVCPLSTCTAGARAHCCEGGGGGGNKHIAAGATLCVKSLLQAVLFHRLANCSRACACVYKGTAACCWFACGVQSCCWVCFRAHECVAGVRAWRCTDLQRCASARARMQAQACCVLMQAVIVQVVCCVTAWHSTRVYQQCVHVCTTAAECARRLVRSCRTVCEVRSCLCVCVCLTQPLLQPMTRKHMPRVKCGACIHQGGVCVCVCVAGCALSTSTCAGPGECRNVCVGVCCDCVHHQARGAVCSHLCVHCAWDVSSLVVGFSDTTVTWTQLACMQHTTQGLGWRRCGWPRTCHRHCWCSRSRWSVQHTQPWGTHPQLPPPHRAKHITTDCVGTHASHTCLTAQTSRPCCATRARTAYSHPTLPCCEFSASCPAAC
jgi:hypothetical protein